jgi:large subunit ribosomal protein L30
MNVKLTQIRSAIGTTKVQKDNLRSLSLGKIGRVSFFNDNDPSFLGRLNVIKHLVLVEKI